MNTMHVRFRISLAALTLLATGASVAAFQANTQQKPPVGSEAPSELQHTDPPLWPYPQDLPKGSPAHAPDDDQPRHVAGSSGSYSTKQIEGASAVDWFPGTHPKPPTAVIDGKPGVYRACGNCHLINGYGKPDEQSVNGLPVAYMQQQLEDMKNDLRHTSLPQGGATNMIAVAKAIPEADAKEALEYFHAVGPAKMVRVVEAGMVPKTTLGRHGLWIPDPSGAMEPIGNRILELPESYERTMLRDPTSGYVAYAPPGSVARGEALAKTGAGGRTTACITCHGADLRGMSNTIPPITGRSPTVIGRQLYDFKTGARHGENSALMRPAADKLTDEDIVDISAYLASLPQ